MCWKSTPPAPAPPPPLPAAGGAPPPAPTPPPAPDAIVKPTDINPSVRMARSKKDKNPQTRGTGSLRIPLDTTVNTGSNNPPSGVNTGGAT